MRSGRSIEGGVGSIAHMTVFSFHPVKSITTGRAGRSSRTIPYTRWLRRFRNHGITRTRRLEPGREGPGTTRWST